MSARYCWVALPYLSFPTPVSRPIPAATSMASRTSTSVGEPSVNEYRLPGQLNLKLGAVILDLEFDFQMDLIGNVRDEP